MPQKEIDYSKSHFYRIVCKDLSIKDCYVGHTTDFNSRKHQHKRTCYDESDPVHYNIYLYQFIRENGGFDNFDMILINTENCENALHARKREREYIEQFNATLNSIKRPHRTPEEKKQYHKDDYEKKRDVILVKNKQKVQCKCGSIVRKGDLMRHERSMKHQDFLKLMEDKI